LGVIHRDLKPSNLMIDSNGNVRVMDFGIARSLESKGITGAGVMIGTPEYMSPEQVEGKEVDQRSDIYSFGVILYEMVTGRVPFEGDTALTIAVKHKTEEPKDPREFNSQISEDLTRVILRCLEKDKDKRYQSAGEVRAELTRIEKGIPTTEIEIPKRKPLTSKEITVTFGLKKLFIPVSIVVVLAIIAIIILLRSPEKEVVLLRSGKPTLAVLHFENNTGEENLDHWRRALSDLLITDLMQSKYIKVLSRDKIFNILSELNQLERESYSSDVLREIADRGRVDHILQGNYTKAGDTFRINAILQNMRTGESISSEMVEGRGEESLYSMVDELTRRIKADLKLAEDEIASDIDKKIAWITTRSPEAYKYYSKGRKCHFIGDFQESIKLMKRAIEIDPGFAMAYRSMAMSYVSLGHRAEYRKNLEKAFKLRDRLMDRERYLIQGDFYKSSEKTFDKAIETYNKLLELYPECWTGNSNSATIYRNLEEWNKVIERCKAAIQSKDPAIMPYVGLSYAYMAKGMYDKANEVLEQYLSEFSENSTIHQNLALNYLCQGKYDRALSEINRAISLSPTRHLNFRLKGDIYYCQADLLKAKHEYKHLLELKSRTSPLNGNDRLGALSISEGKYDEAKVYAEKGIKLSKRIGEKNWESEFHLNLAYMHQKTGNPESALEECNEALRSAEEEESLRWQRHALHFKGLAFLSMKSVDEAQKVEVDLKKLVESAMNRKAFRFYYHLKGRIELENENYLKAIEYFKKALSLLPHQWRPDSVNHALFIDSLALAYYKIGELEKAREEYESIISLKTGRVMYGDIFAKSFYMLGTIYEKMGKEKEAIEHYEKFLSLWKDADPGIAEVEDVKKRVAGLKGQ